MQENNKANLRKHVLKILEYSLGACRDSGISYTEVFKIMDSYRYEIPKDGEDVQAIAGQLTVISNHIEMTKRNLPLPT